MKLPSTINGLDSVSGQWPLLVRCLIILAIVPSSLGFNVNPLPAMGEMATLRATHGWYSLYLPPPKLKHAPVVTRQTTVVHTLEGIVYDANTLRGIHDVRIEAIHQSSGAVTQDHSDGKGGYHLSLTTGVYTITPHIYGYAAKHFTVPITRDTRVDLPLMPAPFYKITGQVFDAHTGYPLRARITITGTPLSPPAPGNETWSQPITGRYSLNLAEGGTYTLSVVVWGFFSRTRTIGPLMDDVLHKDFALVPDLTACTALGYESGLTWTSVLTESFNPWPQETWSTEWNDCSVGRWMPMTKDLRNFTGGLTWCAEADGNECRDGLDTYLQSPALDLSDFNDVQMTFKFAMERNDKPVGNRTTVELSTTQLITIFQRYQTRHSEETVTLSLAEAAGESDAHVRFRYQTPYHGWCQVDDVSIQGTTCEPVLNTVLLYPPYLEDEACPCTTHRHPITFVNHSGFTDTVLITYTASPSLTILDLPDTLGPSTDGAITPFEVAVNVAPNAPPGSTGYITLTASLATYPYISDTMVIATHTPLIRGWEPCTDSPLAVSDHALITAQDYLYQIGGTVDGVTGISDVLRYDPTSDTWSLMASRPMDTDLYMIDGDAVGDLVDEDIYILGGAVDSETTDGHTQIYDITADHWSIGTAAIHAHARAGYAAVALDGLLYRIGGGDSATDQFATQEVAAYNPASDEWDEGAANYLWHVRWPCAGAIDGKLYVAGGLNGNGQGLGSAAVYDALHWYADQMADLPLGVTLWGAADFVQDGKLVCAGGVRGGLTGQITNTVWIYDPIADRWSLGAPLDTPRARLEGTTWAGAGYIVGGRDPTGEIQATLSRSTPCAGCRCQLEVKKSGPDRAYTNPAHPHVVSYTIAIHNTGEVTAAATMTDILPAGVAYAAGLICQGGVGLCQYTQGTNAVGWQGELAPREILTVSFDVTVTASVLPQAEVTVVNTATVSYLSWGGNQPATRITHTHPILVSPPPTLTWTRDLYLNGVWGGRPTQFPLTVMRHDTVTVVDTLTYTDALSRFVTLVEHWPHALLSYRSEAHTAGVTGPLSDGSYGWGVTLMPDSPVILTKTFNVSQTGIITLTGWLTPDNPLDDIPTQSQTVVLAPLAIQKYGPSMPETGSAITYALALNGANGINSPIRVTDTLPTGVAFTPELSPTYGNAWYSPTMGGTSHTIHWELTEEDPSLSEPVTLTFNVTVTAVPRSRVTNTVEVGYHGKALTATTSFNVPYSEITVIPHSQHAVINPQTTATRTLSIINTGTGRLIWAIDAAPSVPWLSIAPSITGTLIPSSSTSINLRLSAYEAGTSYPLDDGVYTTTLSVTSNDREMPTITIPVTLTVQSGCIPVSEPAMTIAPLPPHAEETLSFTGHVAQGTGPITYTWSFGDNTGVFNGAVVSHTYPLSDTYTAIMTATNACGTDTLTQTLHVVGEPRLDLIPAMLNVTLKPGDVTTRALSLYNLGTADMHWRITDTSSVRWVTPRSTEGVLPPNNLAQVYITVNAHALAVGTYTTTLTLNTNAPEVSSTDIPITLVVTTTCHPVSETAFTCDPVTPTVGAPITFTASIMQGSDPITYTWNFQGRSGDAIFEQGQQVTHTYHLSGTYSIVMTATNACGMETITKAIHVKGNPHITLTPFVLHVTLNPKVIATRTLSLYNLGTANLHWHIADILAVDWITSVPTNGLIPPDTLTHVNVIVNAQTLTEGTYNTTLILASNDPATPSIEIPVTLVVTALCQPVGGATFIFDPATPAAEAPITFIGGTVQGSEPITYTWHFGDGTFGQGQQVFHTYAVSDTYPAVMTATNSCGADTTIQRIRVNGEPDICINAPSLNMTQINYLYMQPNSTIKHTLSMQNVGTADLHWQTTEAPLVSWLTTTPSQGVLTPGASTDVDMIIATHRLSANTYTTTLTLNSDAPTVPSIDIPIALVVTTTCQPVTDTTFIFKPTTPTAGAPITFTASVMEGSAPITYTWHFGDAMVRLGQQVTYTYPISGLYTVVMTATNICGHAAITRDIIVMGQPNLLINPSSLVDVTLRVGTVASRAMTMHNTGTAALHWQFSEAPPQNWLTETPSVGTILPHDSQDVTLTFDARALIATPRPYTTTLHLHSNAPNALLTPLRVALTATSAPSSCIPITGATFTYKPNPPASNKTLTLTGTVTQGTPPITYTWDFHDDGMPLITGNPITYPILPKAIPAKYTITMYARNPCPSTESITRTFMLQPRARVYLPVILRN